jgi:hypothetical protein
MQPVLRRTGLRFAAFCGKWWKDADMGPRMRDRSGSMSAAFHHFRKNIATLRLAKFPVKLWKATDTGPSFLFGEPHVGGACIVASMATAMRLGIYS